MKVVGSPLGRDQHGRSGASSVLGGVGEGQYLEFLDVVNRGKVPIPPAVNSLLSTPSSSQSVLFGREPPTDREKEPRAATSLLAAEVKKLLGLVSAVAPEVRVASWTKSRPFKGSADLLRRDDLAERGVGGVGGDCGSGNTDSRSGQRLRD